MKNFPIILLKIVIATNVLLMAYYITLLVQVNELRGLIAGNNIKRRMTVYYPILDKGKPCPRNHYTEDDIADLIPLANNGDCDSLAVLLRYNLDIRNTGEYLDFSRLEKEYQAAGCEGPPCISTFEVRN